MLSLCNEMEFRKGFRMTFANGYMLSVQFGAFNYCGNRDKGYDESPNAEIAVIRPNGEFVPLEEHDDVRGYVTADQIAHIAHIAATNPESLADFRGLERKRRGYA